MIHEEQLDFFYFLDENADLWFSTLFYRHMDKKYVPDDWPPRWEFDAVDGFFWGLDKAIQKIYDATINEYLIWDKRI